MQQVITAGVITASEGVVVVGECHNPMVRRSTPRWHPGECKLQIAPGVSPRLAAWKRACPQAFAGSPIRPSPGLLHAERVLSSL
jgi:hypothetical protein